MRTRFDQLSKAIVDAILQPVAHVQAGKEIPGHVEVADLWVEPDEHCSDTEMAARGVLGRMVKQGACLIEPFSQAPGARDMRPCILKQYALDATQAREAARNKSAEPVFPGMWIIAAGRPDNLIQSMGLCPMAGWPTGFMERTTFDAFRLVIVPMLPDTPETLFLRLLGRGKVFAQAVRELLYGPEQTWANQTLRPVLLAFRREFPQELMTEEEDMDVLRELQTAYDEWEREVLARGEETGRRAELLRSIEALCEVLDIELTAERRELLAAADIPRLEQIIAGLRADRHW